MKAMLTIGILTLALGGCGNSGSPGGASEPEEAATPAEPPGPAAPAEPPEAVEPTGGTEFGDAGMPEAEAACVEECVEQGQMRAEPIEKIRADCEAQCAEGAE